MMRGLGLRVWGLSTHTVEGLGSEIRAFRFQGLGLRVQTEIMTNQDHTNAATTFARTQGLPGSVFCLRVSNQFKSINIGA